MCVCVRIILWCVFVSMCVCDEDSVAKLFVRVCVLKCVLRFQVFINIIYLCVQNIYIPITPIKYCKT